MTRPERLTAPFTRLAAERLNEWQACAWVHPFTCANRGDEAHHAFAQKMGHRDHGMLVATRRGWFCPVCSYRQDWAHEFMLRLPERPPWHAP